MKTAGNILALLCVGLILFAAGRADASLTIGSGLGTTHAGNLVANGSFEIGAPPDGVYVYWADTSNSPYGVPPAWLSNNTTNAAIWGNDGPSPYKLKSSDVLPDGRAGVDFRTATGVTVNVAPTFNPNGTVTFASTPVFSSPAGAPVILRQSVPTHLSPAPSYNMSFWISGEENTTNQGFTGTGIIGLQVTNVLAGDPIQWLAVPNALNYGLSKLYEYTFTPLVPTAPVEIRFINWGGMDLSPHGGSAFGTQPILDDVIINGVPEPSSVVLLVTGASALVLTHARRKNRRRI